MDYCLSCKRKTPTLNSHLVGRRRVGKCAVCGKNKSTFISSRENTENGVFVGGDIQTGLASLPGTPWARFSGEKHLPGYSFCGPGTRLDKRLDANGNPVDGLGPINRVDQACMRHDIAYNNPDLRHRQKADIDLIHDLNAIENPTWSESFGRSATKNAMKGKIVFGGANLLCN